MRQTPDKLGVHLFSHILFFSLFYFVFSFFMLFLILCTEDQIEPTNSLTLNCFRLHGLLCECLMKYDSLEMLKMLPERRIEERHLVKCVKHILR